MKTLQFFLVTAVWTALLMPPSARAAGDILIANYSFEGTGSGSLTGWTWKFNSGTQSLSSAHAVTGSYCLEIADASSTTSYGEECTPVPCTAGSSYRGFANVYLTASTVSAELIIRFYDSSFNYISGTSCTAVSVPLNQWVPLNVFMTAPTGATQMTLVAYSSPASVGTSYWDDFLITGINTDVGPLVSSSTTLACALGPKAPDGTTKDTLYVTETGSSISSAHLIAIDVNTLALTDVGPLSVSPAPIATGAWACTAATDGKIYVGSYYGAHVYQYTPGTGNIPVDLGVSYSGDNITFTLCAGPSGSVFGGNFYCHLFQYTSSGFSLLGSNPFVSGEQYLRSVAYNSASGVIYAGVGDSFPGLYRYVISANSTSTNLLTSAIYSGAAPFAYCVCYEGGKIFCWMDDGAAGGGVDGTMLVLTDSGGTVTKDAQFYSEAGGVSPAIGNKVYYDYYDSTAGHSYLASYDIVAKTTNVTTHQWSGGTVHTVISQLTDQTNWPGYTVIATEDTSVSKYNPQNGNYSVTTLTYPALPNDISDLHLGPTNKIFAGGLVEGGLGTYTPLRSDQTILPSNGGISQIEGMTALGSYLYIGTYPSAYYYKYNPTVSWNFGTNPLELATLGATYNQDRPGAMATDLSGGTVYSGTQPSYGHLGGAFAYYTPSTGTSVVKLVSDSTGFNVPNQCIVSMTNYNGVVYAGSSIEGGGGINPLATSAVLLTYTISSSTYSSVVLPDTGFYAVNAMTVGPDSKIWMTTGNGYLLIYNPATGAWDYNQQVFSSSLNVNVPNHTGRDSMLLGMDGQIYGVVQNLFYRIDPSTKTVTSIYTSTSSLENLWPTYVTQDQYGNIYYSLSSELERYSSNLSYTIPPP